MSLRTFHCLVNPLSGGGAAPGKVAEVAGLLEEAGARVLVEPSRSAEHSALAAREAIEAGQVVVAAGGDGMLASVAATVVDAGGTLGIPGSVCGDWASATDATENANSNIRRRNIYSPSLAKRRRTSSRR